MKIGIVLGSIREERNGTSVATWVRDNAADRADATFEIVDLASFDIPLLTDSVIPAMRGGVYPDARVQAFADAMDAFDGYIVVTPEYNHGIPGGVKNAFDYLSRELDTKPVAFVSYGAERGVRAVEQWRQVVANFNMFDIRAQVTLDLFTDFDGNGVNPAERKAGELSSLLDSLVPMAVKLAA